jgi:hypothetical protein
VGFRLTTERISWYSLIVEDAPGHKASNEPIWRDAVATL